MIVTTTWERKTFRVQAIRVTAENIHELAGWCGGEVKNALTENSAYIIVPARARSTSRARIGDWITRLTDSNNFRVYQAKSFLEAFREIADEARRREEIHEIVMNALRMQDKATWDGVGSQGMEVSADKVTRNILALL